MNELSAYPGGDIVEKGLADLRARRKTVDAFLVRISEPALRFIGIDVPKNEDCGSELPEHQLYELLSKQYLDDAHRQYNALIQRIVSFQHAYSVRR